MTNSSPSDRARPHLSASGSSLPPGYAIRRATLADIAIIAAHRRAMFEEIGATQNLDLVERAFADWLLSRLDATYFHWLATCDAKPIGSAGVLLLDWPPSPRDPRGGLGFIYNVYVEREHRRRGVARATLELLHQWAHDRNLGALALHASEDGRPLYETLGYEPTNEMRKKL